MTTQRASHTPGDQPKGVAKSRPAATKKSTKTTSSQSAPTEGVVAEAVEPPVEAAELPAVALHVEVADEAIAVEQSTEEATNQVEPALMTAEAILPIETEPVETMTSITYAAPSIDQNDAPAKPAALTPAIDIVTGIIGGIGKTQFAHLLTGYYFDRMLKSGNLQPIHLVEGDHKGTKFYKTYQELPAPFPSMVAMHQTVLSDDPAKQSNADFMADLVLESNAPVVINTPANSAESMTAWLLNSDIPGLCKDAGIPLRYWFVCRNSSDSLNAFSESFISLGDVVPHILVKNQFAGQSAQQGEWQIPAHVQEAVDEAQVPVLSMPQLFIQNQLFSEQFHLSFEVARAYDPESFSLAYWQKRLAVGDLLITRWMEWKGSTIEAFLDQWQAYWQNKGLLYTGSSSAEKLSYMQQLNIPLPSVGRNRLNKFLTAGYNAIASAGL